MKKILISTQADLDKFSTVAKDEEVTVKISGEAIINNRIDVYGKLIIDQKITCRNWIHGRGNSTLNIDGRGNSAIRLKNLLSKATISIAAFCCLWMPKDLSINVEKKSDTSVIIKYYDLPYLERHGIDTKEGKVILYKRVSADFKTQEGTKNETLWTVGETITHPDWRPESGECGEGKFHACSTPYFCNDFRSNKGDRYVAIEVKADDLYEWQNPSYPTKIAFRECKVLFECDIKGNQIKAA